MTISLQHLDNSIWLAEPNRLRLELLKVSRIPICPTARQLAESRLERLAIAQNAAKASIKGAKGKIGVIPVRGPIEQRLTAGLEKLGGTSCEEISVMLDVLLADPSVDAIVLHVDSPGGSVYGVEELGEKIYAARGRKKIYAAADSMAASAAYWIASAAETFVVTPGGDVGSVGVYALHVDQSKALEDEGLKVSFVHAGKYKVEGNPTEPLSEEARGEIQRQVDYTYGKFLGAVKRNRGVSLDHARSQFGQGRIVNADDALAAKMVDRIMSFEDLMAKLTGSAGAGEGARRASVEMLRLRQEQRKRMAVG